MLMNMFNCTPEMFKEYIVPFKPVHRMRPLEESRRSWEEVKKKWLKMDAKAFDPRKSRATFAPSTLTSFSTTELVTERQKRSFLRKLLVERAVLWAPITREPPPPKPSIFNIKIPKKKRKSFLAWLCPDGYDIEHIISRVTLERASRPAVVHVPIFNEMHGFDNPPEALRIFRNCEKLFIIRKDSASIDTLGTDGASYADGAKYEIYEGDKESNVDFGSRICLIAQRSVPPEKFRCKRYPFVMAAFNHEGQELFKIEGEPKHCCTSVNVQVQDKEMRFGELTEGPAEKEIAMLVNDTAGDPLFKIQVAPENEEEGVPFIGAYNVLGIQHTNLLISRITPRRDEEGERVFPGIFKIRFTKDLALELKVLIIVVGILLDYRFFYQFG